jgi:dethiobiotin synthetase
VRVVVAGTATDIGKTWFTAATVRALGGRARVVAKKPVQSFDPADTTTDADVLSAATGQAPFDVCPEHRWYGVAIAPPMAAAVLGTAPFTVADLVRELQPFDDDAITFVEGVGGPRSPIADDGDNVDLARARDPDVVVLVADAGLGTINAVRLSATALQPWPLVVALNRYAATDDLHVRNAEWLRTREGLDVVTDPEALATYLLDVRR